MLASLLGVSNCVRQHPRKKAEIAKNMKKTINNHVKKVVTTMLIRGSLKKDQKTKN